MYYTYTAEAWSKALGQIRRLRHRGNWSRIGSSDVYWTSAFFAALVETVGQLLLAEPTKALELSEEGLLLAERIRPADCPGGTEAGKRSIKACAQAVYGSCCRAAGFEQDATLAFERALALAPEVAPWAAGEVFRRYSAFLIDRGDMAALDYLKKALVQFDGIKDAQASTLVCRGVFHQYLANEFSLAAADFQSAIEMVDPKAGPRQGRIWLTAVHNLGLLYSEIPADLSAIQSALKTNRLHAKKLSKHEPFRRMLCLWVEALLLVPLGATRKAARALRKAQRWFFAHNHYHRGALCSIDLILLHLKDGEEHTAWAVLEEMSAQPRKVSTPLAQYLDHRLKSRHLLVADGGCLTAIREALIELEKAPTQPLGPIEGPYSGSSACEAESGAGSAGSTEVSAG